VISFDTNHRSLTNGHMVSPSPSKPFPKDRRQGRDEKYGISVRDKEGGLTLLRILQKLRRHTPLEGNPIPDGIEDLTGRGLFIISRQTRLVINILHGQQTEVILLSYFDEDRNKYKSLIINEKYPGPDDVSFF